MNIRSLLANQESSLRKKVKQYRSVAVEIKKILYDHPNEWGRFQSDFNIEINGIFRDIMNFEKERLAQKDEDSVYKLKRLFINHLHEDFLVGQYIKHSFHKPYGYSGDFRIIEDIYKNDPSSTGFERLYDNYFQSSSISNAVRNRKDDFKKIIKKFILGNDKPTLSVMDLASGPCRDIFELIEDDGLRKNIEFHCFDSDKQAISYARQLFKNEAPVKFFEQNAVRIALMKDINSKILTTYDVIFSTGLFDYLDYHISVRLVSNLRKLLNPGGLLIISDVRDKFSNPSIYFMEWVGDWYLIYRDDDEFRNIFLEAGFKKEELSTAYEQQGIMQYIIAHLTR